MPVARYTYPASVLILWLKAHLTEQKNTGELQDWIMADGTVDKNSVASDQESSAVLAAYEISKSIGYDWLLEPIQSRSILLRLSDALDFLFSQRIDPHTGLIKSGHTADWGDVSNEFPDQRAVDLSRDSQEVIGICTNALAFGAAEKLAEMFAQTGEQDRATYWEQRSAKLREKIQQQLWQENTGFFRIHKHAAFPDHDRFDEGNIFPMGGNAIAIETGVATPFQTQRIIQHALFRQKLFNVSTISGVLLPPYPKDFFRRPILNEYFEYQNGGQWDWFGTRLVLQMFLQGYEEAFIKLREICQKTLQNEDFFEWHTIDGIGQGSSHYTGSATTLTRAIIEGLFGIEWDRQKIRIQPRLGSKHGYIYVPQVETKQFVAYSYTTKRFEKSEKFIITMMIGSNSKLSKTVALPGFFQKSRDITIKINGRHPSEDEINVTNDFIEIHLNADTAEIIIEYLDICL